MSKFRVETQKVLAGVKGTVLRAQWIARGDALALFSVRERAAILKASAEHMGKYWILKWLPERFTGYARRLLGYKSKPKYDKSKRKQFGSADPLTYSGYTGQAGSLIEAAKGATAKGQSGGPRGSPSCIITIPTGAHQLAAIVQQVLKTIPESEVDAMGKEFGEALAAYIRGSERGANGRSRLGTAQRGKLGMSAGRGIGRRGLANLRRAVRVDSIMSRLGKGR